MELFTHSIIVEYSDVSLVHNEILERDSRVPTWGLLMTWSPTTTQFTKFDDRNASY